MLSTKQGDSGITYWRLLRREVFKGEADATLEKELYEKTVAGQSVDGSWGRKGLETETFLVLDALKNVGLI